MYHIFERYGIELEYMVVDRNTFRVLPVTDKIIEKQSGMIQNEISLGPISWSNELVLHVIELKTSEPVSSLYGIADLFHQNILQVNSVLDSFNGILMSGAMHPFMDSNLEMKLWPHDYNPIYEAFNHIFCCKGHGWANLQSMHINLPFANDDEFARLHAAIRMILPVIPAISAGSPVVDGKKSGFLDTRMEVYRTNSLKIPSITGDLIPEPVFDSEMYQKVILEPIYKDLDPFDPEKVLQEEWVNARGAIARFERNSIEIRIIDVQETPFADIAIAAAVIGVIRMLADEKFCSINDQKLWQSAPLRQIFLKTIKYGEHAVIDDAKYLYCMGMEQSSCITRDLWKHLIKHLKQYDSEWISPFVPVLDMITDSGTLASRILKFLDENYSLEQVTRVCRDLTQSLSNGTLLK